MKREYRTLSRLSDGLEVSYAGLLGNGLFATRRFEPDDVLLVYGGHLIDDAELAANQPHSTLAVAEGWHLVQEAGDLAQYVNHSCDPNSWMQDDVTMIARRVIEPGQQVTVDYALVSVNPAWRMTCLCRAPNCRHLVSGSDWQRPELRHRYEGHFSPFINDRIRNLA